MVEGQPKQSVEQFYRHIKSLLITLQITQEIKNAAESEGANTMGPKELKWGIQLTARVADHLASYDDLSTFYQRFPPSSPDIVTQLATILRDPRRRLDEHVTEQWIYGDVIYEPSRLPDVWIKSHQERLRGAYALVGKIHLPTNNP